jgi:hypothetical protein
MTWNDMRKPNKIPAEFDAIEKPATENELLELPFDGLSAGKWTKDSLSGNFDIP